MGCVVPSPALRNGTLWSTSSCTVRLMPKNPLPLKLKLKKLLLLVGKNLVELKLQSGVLPKLKPLLLLLDSNKDENGVPLLVNKRPLLLRKVKTGNLLLLLLVGKLARKKPLTNSRDSFVSYPSWVLHLPFAPNEVGVYVWLSSLLNISLKQ